MSNNKDPMTSYEVFRTKVHATLLDAGRGMTWTDIRETADIPQKAPPNQWVNRLEDEIGLVREDNSGHLIWRLDDKMNVGSSAEEASNGN